MASNVISAIHHLKMSEEFFNDFIRENPESKGERLFKSYISKMRWIVNDLQTYPYFDQDTRDTIKSESESDVFAIPAINEKVALLNPEQREMIEQTIDAMLSGEEVKIVDTKEI
jgi:Fe-S cluster biosynthesis and repair protein YggX